MRTRIDRGIPKVWDAGEELGSKVVGRLTLALDNWNATAIPNEYRETEYNSTPTVLHRNGLR
ncbi:MAG: hypothetical protein AB8B50_02605 [Pirellulaceae bacterium]